MGRWLGLSLHQDGVNGNAVGAWLEVRLGDRVIAREVTIGGGHVSGQLEPMHVGLGSMDRAQVRVQWPDGEQGPWISLEADHVYTLDRATSTAEAWPLSS